MAQESSKAMLRRFKEHDEGGFPWRDIFKGVQVDVGCGNDLVQGCIPFDQERGSGDCNLLTPHFALESIDLLHFSQVYEHLHDPKASFEDHIKVLKQGGHICLTVPEAVLYGDMLWGERKSFNPDHKSAWSCWLKGSPAPIHIYMPDFVKEMEEKNGVKCLIARLVDTNYDYSKMFTVDQTWIFEHRVECWLEMLFVKL